MDLKTLKQKMDQSNYIYDDTLATVLYVALALKRPLLIEGAAGVGKTEVAKVMAAALDRDLALTFLPIALKPLSAHWNSVWFARATTSP